VDYILGLGNHARLTCTTRRLGRSSNSRWGWIPTQPGMAMSPVPIRSSVHRKRFVADECAVCHERDLRFPEGNEAPGSDPHAFVELPEGIDCLALSWTRRQSRPHRRERGAKVANIAVRS
jgi:hypothetical protein